MNLKPTIGRVVLYKALNDEIYPAIVQRVFTDTCVNLAVFYDSGPTVLTSVVQGTDSSTWDWMDYQKEQAAKTEQLDELQKIHVNRGALGQKIQSNQTVNESQVACNGERPIIEMMCTTADRLVVLESRVNTLRSWLFGAEPANDGCNPLETPSIRSEASRAFGSSVVLEREIEEIIHRLAGN